MLEQVYAEHTNVLIMDAGIQSSPVKSGQAGRTVNLDERPRLVKLDERSCYARGVNGPVLLRSRDERSS